MEWSVTAKYMTSGVPGIGLVRMGGAAKNALSSVKAFSHSSAHWNLSFFFGQLKNGLAYLPSMIKIVAKLLFAQSTFELL